MILPHIVLAHRLSQTFSILCSSDLIRILNQVIWKDDIAHKQTDHIQLLPFLHAYYLEEFALQRKGKNKQISLGWPFPNSSLCTPRKASCRSRLRSVTSGRQAARSILSTQELTFSRTVTKTREFVNTLPRGRGPRHPDNSDYNCSLFHFVYLMLAKMQGKIL